MIANTHPLYISPEDYLEGERISPVKHEYRSGQVYAMTGAKNPHVIIAGNVASLLHVHLSSTPCIVLTADTKVRLLEANCYYYPDVVVTCDERDITSIEDFILYPMLVVEVLSASTAAFDRGGKFADYRTLPTLQEYVLINQSHRQVECFRCQDGAWTAQTYGEGEMVNFISVDFQGPIAAFYQKVPGLSASGL